MASWGRKRRISGTRGGVSAGTITAMSNPLGRCCLRRLSGSKMPFKGNMDKSIFCGTFSSTGLWSGVVEGSWIFAKSAGVVRILVKLSRAFIGLAVTSPLTFCRIVSAPFFADWVVSLDTFWNGILPSVPFWLIFTICLF